MLWIVCAFAVFGFIYGIIDAIYVWLFGFSSTVSFSPIVLSLGSFGILMFALYVMGTLLSDEKKSDGGDDTDDLVSIRTNHGISGAGSGSFLLYTVSIEDKYVYAYFCRMKDGSLRRKTIDTDNASIFEEEVCTRPRVEAHKTIITYNHPILTGILAFGVHGSDDCSYSYDIFVPKGTVASDFKLDWLPVANVIHNDARSHG